MDAKRLLDYVRRQSQHKCTGHWSSFHGQTCLEVQAYAAEHDDAFPFREAYRQEVIAGEHLCPFCQAKALLQEVGESEASE